MMKPEHWEVVDIATGEVHPELTRRLRAAIQEVPALGHFLEVSPDGDLPEPLDQSNPIWNFVKEFFNV